MGFLTVFVRHPILAAMINLALVVVGLFSYSRLGVDLMPPVDQPVVTIETNLEGASPSQIETQITRRVEGAAAQVGGILEMDSVSSQGKSQVTVTFTEGHDPEQVLQECRDKVDAIFDKFPTNTKQPIYTRSSTSDAAVIYMSVSGDRTLRELTYMVNTTISDAISSVDGVSTVKISGASNRQIQVLVDPVKLQEHNLSVTTIQNVLKGVGQEIPGGWITSKYAESLLQISTQMPNVAAFNEVVLLDQADQQGLQPASTTTAPDGTPIPQQAYATAVVKLGDVATVVDGVEDQRTLARFNGNDALVLKVMKNTEANLVDVADGVKSKLKDLKDVLPPDIRFEVIHDSSIYVKDSVDEMTQHLILGALLASFMVLVFLGNFRLTLIAALAIPVSILSTFILMDFLGYTLNYMTLLALTLAVGLVIDDAVVVLENIWRLMEEQGMPPEEASIQGMKEIGFAVLATTLSLVVLFMPLTIMPGQVGQYFRSWGIVLAFSITMSMFVSFTLTPMMCAHMLRPVRRKPGTQARPNLATRMVQAPYVGLLKVALKVRWLVILLSLVCVVWGLHLLKHTPTEFITKEDEGHYDIDINLPRGWSIDRISETLRPIEQALEKLPHVQGVLTTTDTDYTAEFEVVLVPWDDRKPYTTMISQVAAQDVLNRYPYLTGLSSSPDFQLKLQGDDLGVLEKAGDEMVAQLSKIPGFVGVQSSLRGAQPAVTVTVDRLRAADLQVDADDAGQAVQILIGGVKVTTYMEGDETYDVLMRLPQEKRDVPQRVNDLWVASQSPQVGLVPLAEVATITPELIPSEIERYNRRRTVTIQSDLGPQMPQGQAMDKAKEVLQGLNLPPGYGAQETGSSKLLKETALFAVEAFFLSVILMYMVLAVQFENLLDPVLILLTLPLAIPFALFSLQIAHMTLNLFSVLGLFLLFGIVKKNAILQIDRTNQLLLEGKPLNEAILDANRERLRPILMTTLTLVVAMIPPALAGPTGATRAPMAVVIVGGQGLCLLLTLLLVPAASSYVDQIKRIGSWPVWQRLGLRRKPAPEDPAP